MEPVLPPFESIFVSQYTTSPPLSPSAKGMSCPVASMTDALRVAVSSTARLTESGEIVSESGTWSTFTRTMAGSTYRRSDLDTAFSRSFRRDLQAVIYFRCRVS